MQNKVFVVLYSYTESISYSGSWGEDILEGIYSNIDAAKQHIQNEYNQWVSLYNDDRYEIKLSEDCTKVKRLSEDESDVYEIKELYILDNFIKEDK